MANQFSTRPDLIDALVPKSVFLQGFKSALDNRWGYAASKLGHTEKHLLAYRMLLDRNAPTAQLRMLEL